jgi:dihydroneopterin aldolase
MTRLLALVETADECAAALEIVDLVEAPRALAATLDGRTGVRLEAGQRPPEKAAFARAPFSLQESAAFAALAAQAPAIAVLYVDGGYEPAAIAAAARAGARGVCLEVKGAPRLVGQMSAPALRDFCEKAHGAGLEAWLAGGLEIPDAPRLLLAGPDVLCFGGALRRNGAFDADLARLAAALAHGEADAPHDPERVAAAPDRIFVRNFEVSARVGAYAFEREAPQKIVFHVEAEVARPNWRNPDLRSIVSYDLIVDAIRLTVARGHTDFVETIAEEVAARVLDHPRVRSVTIEIEKRAVIDGAVGVRITRARL